MVICCSFVVFDMSVLCSDLISFRMERLRIVMVRGGDHGNGKPYLVIIRSAFYIPEINSSSSSLM